MIACSCDSAPGWIAIDIGGRGALGAMDELTLPRGVTFS